MIICLAWIVRAALLVLYIPLRLLTLVVEWAHGMDQWASSVVMKSAGSRAGERQSKGALSPLQTAADKSPSGADPEQDAYSSIDPAFAFEMTRPEKQPTHRV